MNATVGLIRDGLKTLPQVAAQTATSTPDLRSIFTAKSHAGAIDPTRELVVGDRGVGKSFWSSVLRDNASRTAIRQMYPELHLETWDVSLGFAEDIGRPEYPSSRTLKSLIDLGIQPELIWRAVLAHAVGNKYLPTGWSDLSWRNRVEWITSNSEEEEKVLNSAHQDLVNSKRRHLIIFDALDRLGQDWSTIRALVKALLSVALEMRSYSNFGMNIFLRPDMDGDREIWAIRDGSKLRQNITLLQWSSRDLYGFVWHWFLHSSDTRAPFAKMAHSVSDVRISIASGERLVKIPDAFMEDENLQKKIFEMISGDMMGAGSKKGHPFTWIPKHLADARGRVSLRSFIIALREAARSTPNSSSTPLAYDAIKKGVQQASLNRVEQLKEDYAWIDDVLKPLANLQTPNEAKSFIERREAEKNH
ncbi:hypothetical protein [Methylobacterium sp. B4]|uniref:hypothetical protein n=1 Tax=Methylobacterium sp. B4 TaxID=1938755 RepID=UPI000D91AF69|nr:hypothetical protein [Methylobacterium sp. B4]PXW63761.1 hypothetical protein BY998_105142 [Methylobacterium sp. B4]